MKKMKLLVINLLVVSLVLIIGGCEFDLGSFFSNLVIDHEFSEDGLEEIEFFYAGVNQDDFQGSIGLAIKFSTDTTENDYDVVVNKKIVDEVEYLAMTLEKEDEKFRVLRIGEESYYINETDNMYTQSHNSQSVDYSLEIASALMYGILDPNDEEYQWNFFEQREATITDKDNQDLDTVEFEYTKEESDDIMLVNFEKKSLAGIAAIVARIYYEVELNETPTEVTVYITQLPSADYDEDEFEIPSENNGYSIWQ